MPTLLKNSAAEGYRMGSATHVAELDRNAAAREKALDRYAAVRDSKTKMLALMNGKERGYYDVKVKGRNDIPVTSRELVMQSYEGDMDAAYDASYLETGKDKMVRTKEQASKANDQSKIGRSNYWYNGK